MADWWTSLELMQQIFYLVAVLSSAVLIVQFVLNLMGLDEDDMPGDMGVDLPDDAPMDLASILDEDIDTSGLGIISIRTVLAFFVGFGWSGVILARSDLPGALVVLGAFFVGLCFMGVVYWVMRTIYRFSDIGNIEIVNAVGQTGTVYVPIPAAGEGSGYVQVVVQGRLRELAAVTDEPQALPTGMQISVVKLFNQDTLVVRRLEV